MHFRYRLFLIALLLSLAGDLEAAGDLCRGIVTHATSDRLYLRTEQGGQTVIWNGKPKVQVGDEVAAEGQWTPSKFKAALRADWVNVLSKKNAPEPAILPAKGPWAPSWEGNLVALEARVLDSLKTDSEMWLYGVTQGRPFRAVLKLSSGISIPERVIGGSTVRLSGICDLLPAEGEPNRQATDYQLFLRSANDIQILSKPNWWTAERLLGLLAGLAVLIAIVGAWVILLRRRVEAQTQAISEHVAQAAVHEDRQRIARELHDTLEQELTGLRFHLETASSQIHSSPNAAKEALRTATALLARSQRETRETLLDLREDARQPENAGDFCDVIRERIAARCEAAGVSLQFSVMGTERPFGDQSMHHLLRIVTEAAANALKHALASEISVSLTFEKSFVILKILDNGQGCPQNSIHRPPVGHFGLQGMRERATKIGSSFEIQTSPGSGTAIQLTIPYD